MLSLKNAVINLAPTFVSGLFCVKVTISLYNTIVPCSSSHEIMLNFFILQGKFCYLFEFFKLLFHSNKECVMLIDLDLQGHQGSAILRNGHSEITRL